MRRGGRDRISALEKSFECFLLLLSPAVPDKRRLTGYPRTCSRIVKATAFSDSTKVSYVPEISDN